MIRDDIEFQSLTSLEAHRASLKAVIGVLEGCNESGILLTRLESGSIVNCEFLECANHQGLELAPGDRLLVFLCASGDTGVVAGRIGRYAGVPPRNLTLEATESLTLKCGEASVDLRTDGKVMVRGDDVLLRAKGTQRIRAGNVAIN